MVVSGEKRVAPWECLHYRRSSVELSDTLSQITTMAGSKYAYVRRFELPDNLLPGTHIVFRLDGHAFHK